MSLAAMNHWERIRAALQGEEVDRPPISLWRHWPVEDDTPQGLAAATIRWQQEYDFDLVKFMPTGTYIVEDWGAETVRGSDYIGTRTVHQYGVTSTEQWPHLTQLEVTRGVLGQQIEALRLAATELDNRVPILQTIFSPLTTARKLAGDRVFTHLRMHGELLKAGLHVIADTTARFALESLRAGAHGIFFATQCSTYRLLNQAEYDEFGAHYDRIVLDAVRPESELNMLHVHGMDTMFDLLVGYPVEMLNWHDRLTWPDLREALQRFDGLLVGGVNELHTLRQGPVEAVQQEIQDAVRQTNGRRILLGPGCVVPIDVPAEHIRAAVDAVRLA
jgi:uroporphyrinogen decarboxylase